MTLFQNGSHVWCIHTVIVLYITLGHVVLMHQSLLHMDSYIARLNFLTRLISCNDHMYSPVAYTRQVQCIHTFWMAPMSSKEVFYIMFFLPALNSRFKFPMFLLLHTWNLFRYTTLIHYCDNFKLLSKLNARMFLWPQYMAMKQLTFLNNVIV